MTPLRQKIIRIILTDALDFRRPDRAGDFSMGRAEKAADAILELVAPQPPAVPPSPARSGEVSR